MAFTSFHSAIHFRSLRIRPSWSLRHGRTRRGAPHTPIGTAGERIPIRLRDLNCSDIPADKKPVHVTGSDPYGLDRDGDGTGCDS
jgi:hypothetical protein